MACASRAPARLNGCACWRGSIGGSVDATCARVPLAPHDPAADRRVCGLHLAHALSLRPRELRRQHVPRADRPLHRRRRHARAGSGLGAGRRRLGREQSRDEPADRDALVARMVTRERKRPLAPRAALRELERLRLQFGPMPAAQKRECLALLERARLATARDVLALHEALCFLRAYPGDAALLDRAERMLAAFERRADLVRFRAALADTGIAGTAIQYRFFA